MTDQRLNEDPANAMQAAAKELADERRLNVFLDSIIAEEKARSAASDRIRQLWTDVRKAGFDVDAARRKLVWRATAPAM